MTKNILNLYRKYIKKLITSLKIYLKINDFIKNKIEKKYTERINC